VQYSDRKSQHCHATRRVYNNIYQTYMQILKKATRIRGVSQNTAQNTKLDTKYDTNEN